MKLLLISFFLSALTFAQRRSPPKIISLKLPIDFLCKTKNEEDKFCLNQDQKNIEKAIEVKNKNLKIFFRFGFTRTNYEDTNIDIKIGKDSNFKIFDSPVKERTSAKYYNLLKYPGLRWIDEPTNSFFLSLENDKNQYYLTIFHPKYLLAYKWDIDGEHEQLNPYVLIKGVHQGVNVNGYTYFSEQSNTMKDYPTFYELRNTYRQLQISLGYGRKINLLSFPKGSKIQYTPSFQMGIHLGDAYAIYTPYRENSWKWIAGQQGYGHFQGFGYSIGNNITVLMRNGRLGFFIEHRYNRSTKSYPILENGWVNHNLNYHSLTLGLKVQLFKNRQLRIHK